MQVEKKNRENVKETGLGLSDLNPIGSYREEVITQRGTKTRMRGQGDVDDPTPLRLADNLQALYHRVQALRDFSEAPPAPPEAIRPFDEKAHELKQQAMRRMIALLQRWIGEQQRFVEPYGGQP